MSSRTWVSARAALLVLLTPTLSAAQDRSAQEVVELIVRDGPRARAIRAESEVTRQEQAARLAYLNPTVTYSREGAGFTEFLQVQQELRPVGLRGALERAGVAALAAVEAERDARLWSLRAEAHEAIARLVTEQGHLAAAEAYAHTVEQLIRVLEAREREGEGARFDRLRAEQELREARLAAASAAVDAADARASLNALLPADVRVSRLDEPLDRRGPAPPPDMLIERAVGSRAELRALARGAERADLEREAARRARRPAPTLFGGLKRADTEGGRENGSVFGLSAGIPLFDSGGRDAARWVAERQRLELERAAIEQQIRADITRASEAMALRAVAVADDPAVGADELVRIAEVAYREGEVGILELLDAARTAARARTRTLDARLEFRLAQIALERAVGETLWP